MNALQNISAQLGDGPALLLLVFVAKITLVLAVAWAAHAALARANPRWRVLVWRMTAVACVLVVCLAARPPLVRWAVLPEAAANDVSRQGAEDHPSASVSPIGTTSTSGDVGKAAAHPSPSFNREPTATASSNQEPTATASLNREPTATASGAVATVRRSMSTPSPASPAGNPSWYKWILAIWLTGILLIGGRTAVGLVRLRGIRRRGGGVPAWVTAEAAAVAHKLGCRRSAHVRIQQTNEVTTPCLVGIWRPVLLLPARQCNPAHLDELAAILAHEFAHVKGGDLFWSAVLHGLTHSLWFHPLAWRIRSAHTADCDAVCDAIAADYVGDAAAYGRTLARLAVRIASPIRTHALAMARTSSVRQRIEALRRHVFRGALPRGRAAVFATLGVLTGMILGGVALTRAEEETSPQPPAVETPAEPPKSAVDEKQSDFPAPTMHMIIHAAEKESGEPLAGVQMRFVGRIGEERYDRRVETDENGLATIEWQSDAEVQNLWMTAEKQGLVPVHYTWRSDGQEIELPTQLDLRFAPGHLVGGVVHDKEGKPNPGATVELSMPTTWPRLDNYSFTAASLTTDEDGRWEWNGAPSEISSVRLFVRHHEYLQTSGKPIAAIRSNVFVLKQGLKVPGRVVDTHGNPIGGAIARLGTDRFGSGVPESVTDDEGRFVLHNCSPGKSVVTVEAKGFAPQLMDLEVGEQSGPLAFQLAPGHVMRVRVVDVRGKPVEGAIFVTDTWRGYRTLEFRVQTDAERRVEWNGAPSDAVLCDILKSGYMAIRKSALAASAEEQVVTLDPELVIHGEVTDATTGNPIPLFGLRRGAKWPTLPDLHWPNDDPAEYVDGKYGYKFDEPSDGYMLEAVAPGYLPARSRVFQSDEGRQRFDFALQPGDGPSGIVLLPSGDPAADADVALATRARRAFLGAGYIDRSENDAPLAKTDEQGRFVFLPQDDEPYMLVVLHEAGYAEIHRGDFDRSNRITLTPWGRIEGRVLMGDQPDANREVFMQPRRTNDAHRYVGDYGYTTKTDQNGRFVFDRAIAGPGIISRVVVKERGSGSTHSPGWQKLIDVAAAETRHVQIGGTGRPVIGQLKVDPEPGVEIDWTANSAVDIGLKRNEDDRVDGVMFRGLSYMDASGRFRIPDVHAGNYQLDVAVNEPPGPDSHGFGARIGHATLEFTVPEMPGGRSNEPLDLGTITAELLDTLDPGELAPDFVAERLTGGSLRLRELHRKLVLLQFWSTQIPASLAETADVQKVFEQFGENPRFAIVSLSRDDEIDAAREYVKKLGWQWSHAHTGPFSPAVQDYMVRTSPATFLIGPDGRLLAKNLRGDELKQAIAAALADEALFERADAKRPPRFPVIRYEPTGGPAPLAVKPSVIVLDDCDPKFEKNEPRADGLHALSSSGEALWANEGFNTAGSVGGVHGVAIDRERGRTYVRESIAERIHGLELNGRKLWQVDGIKTDVLAVDEKTGNVWCSGGDMLKQGQTVVFDAEGNEVTAYPYRAIDMAYDPHDDAFWLVGYEILKLKRDGEVLYRKRVDGWCCASVSVNPTDGSVWIAERAHSDIARSKSRLWLLNADGTTRHVLESHPDGLIVVECDPKSGAAWFRGYRGPLLRASAAGQIVGEPLDIEARNIAISPTTGDVWVATTDAVVRLDASGKVVAEFKFDKPSEQSWLAAF